MQSNAASRVFITSDWHLGGTPDILGEGGREKVGRQICRSDRALTDFIDWVRTTSAEFDGTTEIVVNGDMVDFLSPQEGFVARSWTADETEVIAKLNRIVENTRGANCRGPFDALADFVNTRQCELTILLGNHDVELSLPGVRAHLRSLLRAVERQFRFVYDGEAYTRGKLLVEHGNRYDPWNSLNYTRLRAERSTRSRRLLIDETERADKYFNPPAGSLLVIYAFNILLPEYPFINLLKPETGAVIPLLLFLKPDLNGIIRNLLLLAPVLKRKNHARLSKAAEPLMVDHLSAPIESNEELETLESILSSYLIEGVLDDYSADIGELTVQTWIANRAQWLNQMVQDLQRVKHRTSVLVDILKGEDQINRIGSLQNALKPLQTSDSFNLEAELTDYHNAAKRILQEGEFQAVVFGHTHLQKKVALGTADDPRWYLNTGTWADIMRLPDEALSQTEMGIEKLKEFIADLVDHRIQHHTLRSLGYAEITMKGIEVTSAELYSFCKADPRGKPFEPYEA